MPFFSFAESQWSVEPGFHLQQSEREWIRCKKAQQLMFRCTLEIAFIEKLIHSVCSFVAVKLVPVVIWNGATAKKKAAAVVQTLEPLWQQKKATHIRPSPPSGLRPGVPASCTQNHHPCHLPALPTLATHPPTHPTADPPPRGRQGSGHMERCVKKRSPRQGVHDAVHRRAVQARRPAAHPLAAGPSGRRGAPGRGSAGGNRNNPTLKKRRNPPHL